MSSQDLVSIIIPIFNTGKYFIHCIESCIHQTYTNLEIILVDDCSTDPYTLELLQQYASQDSRIKLVHLEKNSGLSFCRNLGVELSQGKYLTFIDSDDRFTLTFVERNLEAIHKSDADLVLSQFHNYLEGNLENDPYWHKVLQRKQLHIIFAPHTVTAFQDLIAQGKILLFPVNACSKFFNAERYKKSGLTFNVKARYAEDERWCARLVFALKNFYYLPMVSILRVIHCNSLSSITLEYVQGTFESALDRFQVFKAHGQKHYGKYFLNNVINNSIPYILTQTEPQSRPQQLIECLQKLNSTIEQNLARYPATYSKGHSDIWSMFYKLLNYGQNKLSLWFFSLSSIYDQFDSTQQSLRRCLDGLTEFGWDLRVLNGSAFSLPVSQNVIDTLYAQYNGDTEQTNSMPHAQNALISTYFDNAFKSYICRLRSKSFKDLSEADHKLLEQILISVFNDINKPDVVLVTGSDPCSLKLFCTLKQQGCHLIYVATGLESGFFDNIAPAPIYSQPKNLGTDFSVLKSAHAVLDLFDHVISFAPCYAEVWRHHISQKPITCLGYLARRTYAPDLAESAQYVTITSNLPPQGIAIFIKAALVLQQTNPEIKFLVLTEPYFSAQQLVQALYNSNGQPIAQEVLGLKNLTFISKPLNLDSVYDYSLLMLLPDLDQNRSVEPVVNALVNGVPVITTEGSEFAQLASATNKLNLEQVVTQLPVPACTLSNPTCLPSDEDIKTFVEAIVSLWSQNHTTNRKIALQAYDLDQIQAHWRNFFAEYAK